MVLALLHLGLVDDPPAPEPTLEWATLARPCAHPGASAHEPDSLLDSARRLDPLTVQPAELWRVAAAWDEKARCETAPAARAAAEAEALRLCGRLLSQVPPPARVDEALGLIALLLSHTNPRRAVDAASQLLREHPQSPQRLTAYLVLGDIYWRAQDSQKASKAYEKALALAGQDEPARSYTLVQLARYEINTQSYEDAVPRLVEAMGSPEPRVRAAAGRWLGFVRALEARWIEEDAAGGGNSPGAR